MKFPIPQDWDGQSWCRWAICWPDSPLWEAMLLGFITTPKRGRFWDERSGNIRDTQLIGQEIFDRNFPFQEVIMACNDTAIADALNAIAQALIQSATINNNSAIASAGGCCDDTVININGGLQGTVTQPVGQTTVPIYGTQEPIGVPAGTFPEGYESEEEYLLAKCQIANGIIDGAIATLIAFSAISLVQTTGLAALILAAVTGMIVLGPLMIPLLIGALLAMVGFTGLLATTAQAIQDDREHWVCVLYEGETVVSIIATLADLIDIIIVALGTTSIIGAAIKVVLLAIFNSDTLNQLMTYTASFSYPEADCSQCDECQDDDPATWELAYFGENFSITNGIISVDPTEDVSNNVFYSVIVNFTEIASVSQVAAHIKGSPNGTYAAACNIYDDMVDYPDTPVAGSGFVAFTDEEDMVFNLSGTNIVAVILAVRKNPPIAPTDFDHAEFSAICVS